MSQLRSRGVCLGMLAMLGALSCGRSGANGISSDPGSGKGGAGGQGMTGPRGVGWWTMAPPVPGTIGGTPGAGGQSGGGTNPGNGTPGNGMGGSGSSGTGSGGSGSGGPGAIGGGGQPVTYPGTNGAPMSPHLPGGGVAGNTALAPGCTPASATECPTLNGACATGAGATVTVTKYGTLCLSGEMTAFNQPAATIEYLQETTNGQSYYRFRVTMNPYFVDNTYGASSIGWPHVRGHRYGDLVKSDHTELQLFNAAGDLSLHFKMDYITENTARMCGYGTLGVRGGDGKMIVGNPDHVLAVGTSLDRNLNACGYCKSPACNGDCTIDSPMTDMNFSTNPQAPNWDFRLVYDVWIAPAAFGASGFGKANISYVHASPAKGGTDTIIVKPNTCPPNWDNPYPPGGTPSGGGGSTGTGGSPGAGGSSGTGTGGSSGSGTGGGSGTGTGGTTGGGSACPINWQEYLTSEGKSTCVPNPTPTAGGGATCPVDWMLFITSEGKATCIPAPTPITGGGGSGGGSGSGSGGPVPAGPGGSCPINYEVFVSSEGKQTCLPTGSGGPGAGTGGGVPVGPGGSCPINYEIYVSSEGKRSVCLPTGPIPIGPGGTCPAGYEVVHPMEGNPTTCAPIGSPGTGTGGTGGTGGGTGGSTGSGSGSGGGAGSGVMCPIDWTVYVTSEGKATCTPTPRGTSCPIDWTDYVTSEGKNSCVPTPRNGVCPEGYKYDVSSEGRYCL
jgi:hypothetical protein